MKIQKTCGEALIQLLGNYDVDTVFGIPGVHTIELYRGLAASPLKHITPRHEQGAGFMADGYARVTGKPGTCFVITGPGMTNIVTAMGQALQESVPMLVISSVNRTHHLNMTQGRLHELPDQMALTSQVTRFSHSLRSVDNLPAVIAQAFAVFSCQRPGPVHIEIPIDLLAAEASHLDLTPWPAPRAPAANMTAIEEALCLLTRAQRPLMILGGGARHAGAAAAALAEHFNMPIINTCNGKGVVPSTHPLSVGSTPSHPAIREEIEQRADVVLAVGTELSETDYDFFFLGDLALKGELIRIDIDRAQLMTNHRPSLPILADAKQTLEALAQSCRLETVVSSRTEALARVELLKEKTLELKKLSYTEFFDCLKDIMGDCIIVADSTQPAYYAQAYYETSAPGRYFHSTTGYGTLGYAFPAAIGACAAQGDLPVVGLIGDGGGQFSLSEIISAVDAQMPVIFIVWNNSGHGEIRRFMDEAKVQREGVDIASPDYVALAKSMGCGAVHVASLPAFKDALTHAKKLSLPYLIDVSEQGVADGYAF